MNTAKSQRFISVYKYLVDSRKLRNQKELVDLLGCSKGYISAMCTGLREPSDPVLEQICNLFPEVSLGWILSGEGSMLRDSQPQPQPSISQQNVHGDNTVNGGGSGDEDARVFKALYTEKCRENEALNLRVAKLMAKLMDLGIDIKGCDL